jgi:predicted RNase H-like nuclease (RuvC/YqgF family)
VKRPALRLESRVVERQDDVSEAAAKHIRELDEHLERLKRQNEALDALAENQEAEVEQLKRLLSEAARHFGKDDAPG